MPPRKPKPKKPPTPKQPKAWDVRPVQPIGSPTADDVYLAIGKALTQWEGMEVQLSQMYLLFVGRYYSKPGEYRNSVRASLRAYGSVTNFSARAEMVENAAEVFFQPHSGVFFRAYSTEIERKLTEQERSLHETFESLMTEARGFAARRNEIAHGVVGGPKGFFLSPVDYNPRKYPKRADGKLRTYFESATYHYTAADIDYYRDQFSGLRSKMLDFLEIAVRVLGSDSARERQYAARLERK